MQNGPQTQFPLRERQRLGGPRPVGGMAERVSQPNAEGIRPRLGPCQLYDFVSRSSQKLGSWGAWARLSAVGPGLGVVLNANVLRQLVWGSLD